MSFIGEGQRNYTANERQKERDGRVTLISWSKAIGSKKEKKKPTAPPW